VGGVPVRRPIGLGAVALLLLACGASGSGDAAPGGTSGSSGNAGGPDATADGAGPSTSDGGVDGAATGTPEAGAGDTGAVTSGPPPSVLPVGYVRPDVGPPLTPAEIAAATDDVIAILKGTRYFDVVDERIHGWPESEKTGYWYGTWWSGVTVTKAGGLVTYKHSADGADNNGLRTAPFLEGACYAHLMTGRPLTAHLVRKIARGYSSWALAMKRDASDGAAPMLARAHYARNVTSTDDGRTFAIDVSADLPGTDGTSQYVHLPSNPTFGDIWIKNLRSKDDMGHVFRSMVQAGACTPRLDAAGQADLAQMNALYAGWSQQVQKDGWGIATLDKSAQPTMPPVSQTLAHYTLLGNIECPGPLMMSYFGSGNAGSLDCGNGISAAEQALGSQLKNGARQILRTHHEAAVNAAFLKGATGPGLPLLQGLASRVETDRGQLLGGSPPADMNPTDIASLVLHAANAGVPLTSDEVRWIHGRIKLAAQTYLAPSASPTYHVFDAATPDGTYAYEPGGDGLFFGDIGVLLGQCAAPYRNTATRTMLDCTRLAGAL
jgi:hypothetical protein